MKELKLKVAKIIAEEFCENLLTIEEVLDCIKDNKDIIKQGNFSINFNRLIAKLKTRVSIIGNTADY